MIKHLQNFFPYLNLFEYHIPLPIPRWPDLPYLVSCDDHIFVNIFVAEIQGEGDKRVWYLGYSSYEFHNTPDRTYSP